MSAVGTLWRFSRPHTVVGSLISICTLYAMVCARAAEPRPALLAGALLIGVCCNIFIVGLNQLADVEVDRVNKPYLPLPAGELSRPQAWSIVLACLGLGLVALLRPNSNLIGRRLRHACRHRRNAPHMKFPKHAAIRRPFPLALIHPQSNRCLPVNAG